MLLSVGDSVINALYVHVCTLKGGKWWQSGDDPWQVLACCMEITDAIRSGDPPNFISHIPVHQVCHHPSLTYVYAT